jgi:hypothetical protein
MVWVAKQAQVAIETPQMSFCLLSFSRGLLFHACPMTCAEIKNKWQKSLGKLCESQPQRIYNPHQLIIIHYTPPAFFGLTDHPAFRDVRERGYTKLNRSITLANGCYSPSHSSWSVYLLSQEREETRRRSFTDLCYAFDCRGCIPATSTTQALFQVIQASGTPSDGMLIVMLHEANAVGYTRGTLIFLSHKQSYLMRWKTNSQFS